MLTWQITLFHVYIGIQPQERISKTIQSILIILANYISYQRVVLYPLYRIQLNFSPSLCSPIIKDLYLSILQIFQIVFITNGKTINSDDQNINEFQVCFSLDSAILNAIPTPTWSFQFIMTKANWFRKDLGQQKIICRLNLEIYGKT